MWPRRRSSVRAASLTMLACLAVASVGCTMTANSGGPLDQELADILDTLPGRYAGQVPSGNGETAMLYHTIEPVSLPELGDTVIHHVISREGFDDPEPFQQKFYTIDRSAKRQRNQMSSVVMMRTGRWEQGDELDAAKLIRFPQPDCAIVWNRDTRGLVARVKRGDCVYESAALGGAIIPDMTYIVTEDDFAIQDLLYKEDGTLLTPGAMVTTPRRR